MRLDTETNNTSIIQLLLWCIYWTCVPWMQFVTLLPYRWWFFYTNPHSLTTHTHIHTQTYSFKFGTYIKTFIHTQTHTQSSKHTYDIYAKKLHWHACLFWSEFTCIHTCSDVVLTAWGLTNQPICLTTSESIGGYFKHTMFVVRCFSHRLHLLFFTGILARTSTACRA